MTAATKTETWAEWMEEVLGRDEPIRASEIDDLLFECADAAQKFVERQPKPKKVPGMTDVTPTWQTVAFLLLRRAQRNRGGEFGEGDYEHLQQMAEVADMLCERGTITQAEVQRQLAIHVERLKKLEQAEPKDGWTLVGLVPVDTGTIVVADPQYATRSDFEQSIGDAAMRCSVEPAEIFDDDFADGSIALGIISPTGFGDGRYPVFAMMKNGRMAELRILFQTDDD